MLEKEVLQLNTLLKKYKEHLCILYKNESNHYRCKKCREAEYDEYTGQYICGVENFADNFREEFEEDVDFSKGEV